MRRPLPGSPLAAQSSALPPRLGTIEFPTSGAAAAQPHRYIWHGADADIPGRADITRFFTQHPTE